MSSKANDRSSPSAAGQTPAKRRSLLLGAGVAGAAALAAKTFPVAPAAPQPPTAKMPPDTQAGYQLTQHVLRYYETIKV